MPVEYDIGSHCKIMLCMDGNGNQRLTNSQPLVCVTETDLYGSTDMSVENECLHMVKTRIKDLELPKHNGRSQIASS